MPSPANKVMSLKLNDAASVGFPAITDTVDGADKRLLFVQSFQLAAQVFNVAVDGAVGYYAVVVIKMVQQLLAGEHFSWFMRERFQETKLLRRQVNHYSTP